MTTDAGRRPSGFTAKKPAPATPERSAAELAEEREQARLDALADYDILDTAAEADFDDLVNLAAKLTGMPMAAMTLLDRHRQWLKARRGDLDQENERKDSVCEHVVMTRASLMVPDLADDARFSEKPAVRDVPYLRFYAGAPLTVAGGHTLGALCVMDLSPHELNADQLTILEALARQAVVQLELRHAKRVAEERTRELFRVSSQLHGVLDHAQAPIYVKDSVGQYIVANRALRRLIGQPTDDPYAVFSPTEFLPPEVIVDIRSHDAQVLVSGEAMTFEERSPHPDGTWHDYISSKFPLPDDDGELNLLGGISLDITEINRSRDELIRSRELLASAQARAQAAEAEAASRAKDEFLSRMSHELRTPLNAVLGFAQLLQLDQLTESQDEAVGHILRGAKHLLEMINDVLDIANIEIDRLPLSIEAVNLSELVAEAVGLLQPVAATRRITIGIDHTAVDETLYLQSDRRRLNQIILNLLTNAIKYNHDGGRVDVTAFCPTAEMVTIAVVDNGMGIAEEDLPKLFTPFERLGRQALDIEGSGIGLSLCHRLATAMGGDLGVRSVEGQGSTFTVNLPRAAAPESPDADSALTNHVATHLTPSAKASTLLYIEDNPSNIAVLDGLVRRLDDWTMRTAMTAAEGLAAVEAEKPDLILLDLHLPDHNGDEVLGTLKANPQTRDIPVAILSADASPAQAIRLRSAGAARYLTKPLDISEILEFLYSG